MLTRRSLLKRLLGSSMTVTVPTAVTLSIFDRIWNWIYKPFHKSPIIIEGEEILVPTWEIASNPQVRLSEIKARRFYIVDRAQIRAKEAIQAEEDQKIFRYLRAV